MEIAKEICPTTTFKKVADGVLLIDVRETNEVQELSYNVPNIIHIPLSELEERYNEVPKNIDVVMVCRSGARSLKATYFLMNHGWTNVSNMQHGIIRWVQKGFPTTGNINSVNENTNAGDCCDSNSKSTSCC